ncbi:hypothetical protein Tco_1153320 [Tanacetum coccineum]
MTWSKRNDFDQNATSLGFRLPSDISLGLNLHIPLEVTFGCGPLLLPNKKSLSFEAQIVDLSLGLERQPDAAVGPPRAAKDASIVDEDDQAVLAPVQAPPPPLAAARTMPKRMSNFRGGCECRFMGN